MIATIVLFVFGLFLIGIVQKVWSDEVYRERQSREYEEEFHRLQNERIEKYTRGVRFVEKTEE